MGHIHYFNVAGYFNGLQYVQDRGFNLHAGVSVMGQMSETHLQLLNEALQRAESASREGDLAGVLQLVDLVDQLQDAYNVPKQYHHRHAVEILVRNLARRPALAKHYGLEGIAAERPAQNVTTKTAVKKRTL